MQLTTIWKKITILGEYKLVFSWPKCFVVAAHITSEKAGQKKKRSREGNKNEKDQRERWDSKI